LFLTPCIHSNCYNCSADVVADVAVVDATLDDMDDDCSADVAVGDVNSGVVYVAYYSSRRPLLYTFTIKCTR